MEMPITTAHTSTIAGRGLSLLMTQATKKPMAVPTMPPNVDSVNLTGDKELEVDVLGTEEACCDLLASLVKSGYRVVEFKPRRAGLEEIFMNVTRGEVQ